MHVDEQRAGRRRRAASDIDLGNVGLGPDPADGASDCAGIYVAGETDSGSNGTGAVQIYNNTR
jgi:hypothetical protein